MQELGAAACLALLAFVASAAAADTTRVEDLTDGYRAGLVGAAVLLAAAALVALTTPRSLGRAPAGTADAATPVDN